MKGVLSGVRIENFDAYPNAHPELAFGAVAIEPNESHHEGRAEPPHNVARTADQTP